MQKLDSEEDLRVRRTRKLLQQALIEGTMEKGFAALTVRDITRRAMVNPSTFYRHYFDKYDLLEQHLNEIYEALEEEGGIIGEGRNAGSIDEGIIELFKQIQQFPDFYRVMLSAQADAFLSQRFRQQTQQIVLAYFHQTFPEATSEPDTLPLDLKFTTIASAGCSALGWWLEQERPSTPEQFAYWVGQMSYDISISTLKPKTGCS